MTTATRRIRVDLLRSKVARRVFLLFILCALLPLGAMALFSFLQVRAELNTLSVRRLQQASKSAGMAVVERLSFLDSDLRQVIANLPSLDAGVPNPPPVNLSERTGDRFRSLTIVADDRRVLSSLFGSADVLPALTGEERSHIQKGETLVTTGRGAGNRVTVFLARLIDPSRPGRGLLLGAVNPDHLWGGDGFLTPPTELSVLDQANKVIFSTMPDDILPGAVTEASKKDGPKGQFEWSHNGDRYVASYWTLFMRPVFLNSWVLVQSERKADVLEPLRNFALMFFLVVLLTFWVATFLSLSQIRRSMVPIELLRDATRQIKNRQFSHRVSINTDDEFAELGASFNEMTESMENHVRVMSTINSIGVSLSAEKNDARLLEIILRGAQMVFNADGAVLFLMSRDDRLELAMIHLSSLGLWVGGSAPGILQDLSRAQGADAGASWAATGAMERTIATPDVYAETNGTFAPQIELDRRVGYHSRSFLSTPLRNHYNEVIGILQLVNAQAGAGREVAAFSAEDQRLAESLASQAAVALTKNKLVADFKGLFEGLTELIGQAIDEKSPYTGGHVRRVVDLAMMIARAARTSGSGALREFANSEDELYELRIAALLHDCGKITTPVHIQDKGTKLETIWDRIHLIETRSEILRRDHRAALLEEAVHRLGNGASADLIPGIDRAEAAFDHQLDEDLKVLRMCNKGSEHMPEMLQEEVRAIARKYRWVNASNGSESLISQDELHHLTIPSGTVSPEERDILNNHVVTTIRMLEKLPYPKNLRDIPLYAGSHHERMDGTGYPRRLGRDAIPIAGRIIGIADIFEALTASDRPYKKAKSLPEAMRILRELARSGHIDPELYEVFVSQNVHLRYAEEHLNAGKSLDANVDDGAGAGAQP